MVSIAGIVAEMRREYLKNTKQDWFLLLCCHTLRSSLLYCIDAFPCRVQCGPCTTYSTANLLW
jgi:hypothetical protein